MQFDAPFGQLDWERCGVRSFFFPALNCFVRNEPRVATATEIAPARVGPAGDVAFVLIWNSYGKPIEFDTTGLREVKNIFVAIIQESFGADRLEMPIRANLSVRIFDGDRFDPLDHVLQHE